MRKLKLKRQITTSKAATASNIPVPFEYGGLSGRNLELSIEALNTIKSTDLGVNIPVHKTADLIDMNDIELKDVLTPKISGPSMVYHNTLHNYTIDNYDSFVDYEISADYGTIANVNKNHFSYVGPNTNYQEDYVHITINGFIDTIKLAKCYIETPTIEGLSNGDNIEVRTNLSFSDYIIRNGYVEYDQHASTDIQICRDNVFRDNTVINLLNNVSYKRSYIIPDTLEDGEYYIRIRYHSTKGMGSLWSTPIRITLFHQYIEKPTIVSPESGTDQPVDVTFTGSAPSIKNSSHGFLKSEWQLSTDDTFLNPTTITSNDNSYTITTTLTENVTYYVRVKYLSNHEELENSNWSNYITITVTNKAYDDSGRGFYRHESGMGTVMDWVDKKGIKHQTLVLDARYRGVKQWAGSAYNVPELTHYVKPTYYLNNINNTTTSSWFYAATYNDFGGKGLTDQMINDYSYYFEDENTSRQNTDIIMTHPAINTTNYAAGWCRSISVTHKGKSYSCDLPNIQTLIRICCSQFMLDELDGTPGTNIYKFSRVGTGQSYNWCAGNNATWCSWASTQYDASNAYFIDDCYMVYSWSKTYNGMGSIPILELLELED